MAVIDNSIPYDANTLSPEKIEMLSVMEVSRRDFSFVARDWTVCSFVIQSLSHTLLARGMKEISLLQEKLHDHPEYKVFAKHLLDAYEECFKSLEIDTQILLSGRLNSFQLQLTVPSFDCEKMVVLPGLYQRSPLS